jgi:ATP-dependent Lhr-like helicase
MQWSAPANLDQVQRGSLALLRREVLTCPAPQFADFLLRWQRVHPETRRPGREGLEEVLSRLEGLPLPPESWEPTILPSRVAGYQARWLDEWVAGGAGAWVGFSPPSTSEERPRTGIEQLAFFRRETLLGLAGPATGTSQELSGPASIVNDALARRGACFVTDLAAELSLPPSVVRAALWELVRQGRVSNDHFEVVRRGEEEPPPGDTGARSGRGKALSLRSLRRPVLAKPEGRWSLLTWGQPGPEELAVAHCALLLERYGVAARELALLDPWLSPWRVLYEVLSRMELTGEVRRGYFVEGLSGAQFALPEAIPLLQETHLPSTAAAPLVLLHSQDPANLYGSGAPFDIPLLDGGTRPLLRRGGNWLVIKAGRPVLLAEQQGRRVTVLPSASREDQAEAIRSLTGILSLSAGTSSAARLSVEEWNGTPVTSSEGRELLEAAGFVRDYQQMTLYAAWR